MKIFERSVAIIIANVERTPEEGRKFMYKIFRKKRRKKNRNVVPREVLRPWGRISVHVRDKSLLQGIFRASLKEIELPDLGEQEEKKAGYSVKYGILSYALPVRTETLKGRGSASFVLHKERYAKSRIAWVDRQAFNFGSHLSRETYAFNKFLLKKMLEYISNSSNKHRNGNKSNNVSKLIAIKY